MKLTINNIKSYIFAIRNLKKDYSKSSNLILTFRNLLTLVAAADYLKFIL